MPGQHRPEAEEHELAQLQPAEEMVMVRSQKELADDEEGEQVVTGLRGKRGYPLHAELYGKEHIQAPRDAKDQAQTGTQAGSSVRPRRRSKK
jgi:hypothetical protein